MGFEAAVHEQGHQCGRGEVRGPMQAGSWTQRKAQVAPALKLISQPMDIEQGGDDHAGHQHEALTNITSSKEEGDVRHQIRTNEDGLPQPDQNTFFMSGQRAALGLADMSVSALALTARQRAGSRVMTASALALATAATSARTLASAATTSVSGALASSASMIQPTKTSLLPPLRGIFKAPSWPGSHRTSEPSRRNRREQRPTAALQMGSAHEPLRLVWPASCCTW